MGGCGYDMVDVMGQHGLCNGDNMVFVIRVDTKLILSEP